MLRTLSSPIRPLCHGSRPLLRRWLEDAPVESLTFCLPAIVLGCGMYGLTMGIWHGWEMAAYVAIKLPLAILATLLVNGALNGMLAMVLGSGIGFRQSIQFLLAGFALMSIVLAALSPVTFFMGLNAPEPDAPMARQWHSILLLVHTGIIAYAGTVSHHSLLQQLRTFASTPAHGSQTFIAWLAGNLFVGAQVSWIMRPFFGSPGLNIQFLREHPLQGTFHEAVWRALMRILFF